MIGKTKRLYDVAQVYRAIYRFLCDWPLQRNQSEDEKTDVAVALGEIGYPEDNVEQLWPMYTALAGEYNRNAWEAFVLAYSFLGMFTFMGYPEKQETSASFMSEMREVIWKDNRDSAIYKVWLESLAQVRNKIPWSGSVIMDRSHEPHI